MTPAYFFSKKISLFQTIIICLVASLLIYFALTIQFENAPSTNTNNINTSNVKVTTIRNRSFKYTKPLIGFEFSSPSKSLQPLRDELQTMINDNCSNGNLYQASVYLRDLETGEWTTINADASYHPGSLIKVPMLIYYLKAAETHPEILNKTLVLNQYLDKMPGQSFSKERIEPNKIYTVKELLKYMASYSDNNATYLLNTNCNEQEFTKIFSDLGLAIPNIHDTSYSISVRDYSVFMRVLYNATYLNAQNSDFALSLLAESTFSMGIANKLPKGIEVARKFGEMKADNKRELHESGIIYCNSRPYMLTIMTKGYNPVNLAGFISNVSDSIFHFFCI